MECLRPAILSTAILLALSGCGGGDGGNGTTNGTTNGSGNGSGNPPDTSQNQTLLQGTAAAGAPIIGTVIVKGSRGKIVSRQIEADGNYSVDVSGLTAPYMLRASGTVGGRSYILHSFAEAADVGKTVNITPFTDLIVANAAGQVARSYFENGDFSSLSPEKLAAEETSLQTKLQGVFSKLGVAESVDLLHSSFTADHSDLDAALDIVRVEVDETRNLATLTNIIDKTSLEDDLVDDTQDAPGKLEVKTDLGGVEAEMQAITAQFNKLSALFANGLPATADLEPFFTEDFTNEDSGRNKFLTDITSDSKLVGLTFANLAISQLDEKAGTAVVSLQVKLPQRVGSSINAWNMVKQGGEWKIRGDGRIADIGTGFQCGHGQSNRSEDWYSCGLNIDVTDENTANNQGAGLIRSARITVLHDDQPVPGAVLYAGDQKTVGELSLYDKDYADDYVGFGSTPAGGSIVTETLSPGLFHDNDVAKIELFTTQLDTGIAGSPTITSDPVATYELPIPKAPIPLSEMSGHPYPIISEASKTALHGFSKGNLTISWTLPEKSGLRNSEVNYIVCDKDNDCLDMEEWPLGNSVTFKDLDLAKAGVDADPIHHEIRVYAVDDFNREFTASYNDYSGTNDSAGTDGGSGGNPASGGTPTGSNPAPVDLTHLKGVTVFEVYFTNEETLGCSAAKTVGKIDFTSDTSFHYTGLAGEEAGNSGDISFKPSPSEFVYTDGAVTTFSGATGQSYFMTGHWISGDQKEEDLNYYFDSEAAANAFSLPGCSK